MTMYFSQAAYDNAEPEHDYAREEAAERIGDLIDARDPAMTDAYAEYVNGWLDAEHAGNVLLALLKLPSKQLKEILLALPPELSAALRAITDKADALRADFIGDLIDNA